MSRYQGLTVRHFDRHDLDLPAEVVIAPEHAEQVHFTSVSGGVVDATTIKATVRDVSRGGMGLETPLFLPRMTKATVRIWLKAGGAGERVVERGIRIRRAAMVSEAPSYLLGAQFIAREGESDADLEDLLRLADAHGGAGEAAA